MGQELSIGIQQGAHASCGGGRAHLHEHAARQVFPAMCGGGSGGVGMALGPLGSRRLQLGVSGCRFIEHKVLIEHKVNGLAHAHATHTERQLTVDLLANRERL